MEYTLTDLKEELIDQRFCTVPPRIKNLKAWVDKPEHYDINFADVMTAIENLKQSLQDEIQKIKDFSLNNYGLVSIGRASDDQIKFIKTILGEEEHEQEKN